MSPEVKGRLEELGYTVRELPDGRIEVSLSGVESAEAALNQLVRDRVASVKVRAEMPDLNGSGSGSGRPGVAEGGVFEFADGGLNNYTTAFANDTGIYSGRAGSLYKFAEPETGWEAFISGKPSARDRNRQIWLETGSRLGMDMRGGGGSMVQVPAEVIVKDTHGALVGRMQVEATRAVDTFIKQQAAASRRAE
ncbi:hypothetical protein GCM10009847_00950 [Leucobacter tardus]|uniref:Uncharacterized protein n=1 Tax=Leucobacter tardus TaxID=501483 RepID=A0A939TP82_9MICO|nr:hypothetical protein [Leucobacter tardus]MBO2991004.1 hypothetical protein [Leucobacter tardus]